MKGQVVGPYQTTATVRSVGSHAYVLVEDEVWQTQVTGAEVLSIQQAFDHATPRDSARGIHDIDTQLYGPPPDVDGDPRILILLLDILDSPFTGVTYSGYFDTNNQAAPTRREIIYIDTNPLEVDSPLARATLAHEFQHMLHWNADPDEEKWVDEGCSEYAELACGYRGTTGVAGFFLQDSGANTSLTAWNDDPWEFDQAFLFLAYFAQRFGEEALPRLVSASGNSIAGVDTALAASRSPVRFAQLYADFSTAIFLDGAGDFGFETLDFTPVRRDTFVVPTPFVQRAARLWGTDYLAVDAPGQPVALDVESRGDNALSVTLIAEGADGPVAGSIAIPPGRKRRIRIHAADARAFAVTSTSGTGEGYGASLLTIDAASAFVADFDADGTVAFPDFVIFAQGFGRTAVDRSYNPALDLDGSRTVDFPDFVEFARRFGK